MKKYFFGFLFIPIFFTSCEKVVESWAAIRVRNNSSQTIDVYAAYILPDTNLPTLKPKLFKIQQNSNCLIYDNDVNDKKFEKFKSNKLTFIILKSDITNNVPWDSIRTKYLILKRYETNEQDLKNMGGDLNYP